MSHTSHHWNGKMSSTRRERNKEDRVSHLQDKAVGNETKLQPAWMQVERGRAIAEAAFQRASRPDICPWRSSVRPLSRAHFALLCPSVPEKCVFSLKAAKSGLAVDGATRSS